VAGIETGVLIKDQLPAYITWSQYERNVRQLQPIRRKPSVLPVRRRAAFGLLICGRCGLRMAPITVAPPDGIVTVVTG